MRYLAFTNWTQKLFGWVRIFHPLPLEGRIILQFSWSLNSLHVDKFLSKLWVEHCEHYFQLTPEIFLLMLSISLHIFLVILNNFIEYWGTYLRLDLIRTALPAFDRILVFHPANFALIYAWFPRSLSWFFLGPYLKIPGTCQNSCLERFGELL